MDINFAPPKELVELAAKTKAFVVDKATIRLTNATPICAAGRATVARGFSRCW